MIGHNTDAPAFQQTLEGEIFDCAYILGTGGAARAVAYALGRMGVEYKFVSRHPQGVNILSYEQLVEETQQAASLQSEILIINATFEASISFPLGESIIMGNVTPNSLLISKI